MSFSFDLFFDDLFSSLQWQSTPRSLTINSITPPRLHCCPRSTPRRSEFASDLRHVARGKWRKSPELESNLDRGNEEEVYFKLLYSLYWVSWIRVFALENNIQTAEIFDNLIGRTILAVSCFWLFSPQSLDWLFQYVYSTLSQTRKIHVWWCFWGTWWKLYAKCSFTVAPHLTLASKGVGVSFRRSKSSGPWKINHVVDRRNIWEWKTWGTLSVESSIEIHRDPVNSFDLVKTTQSQWDSSEIASKQPTIRLAHLAQPVIQV